MRIIKTKVYNNLVVIFVCFSSLQHVKYLAICCDVMLASAVILASPGQQTQDQEAQRCPYLLGKLCNKSINGP